MALLVGLVRCAASVARSWSLLGLSWCSLGPLYATLGIVCDIPRPPTLQWQCRCPLWLKPLPEPAAPSLRYSPWTSIGHVWCFTLALLSLVNIDVRFGAAHSNHRPPPGIVPASRHLDSSKPWPLRPNHCRKQSCNTTPSGNGVQCRMQAEESRTSFYRASLWQPGWRRTLCWQSSFEAAW